MVVEKKEKITLKKPVVKKCLFIFSKDLLYIILRC